MSAFRQHPRTWCADCGGRIFVDRRHPEVCRPCMVKAIEREERDEERRSLRGYTDTELERI